MPPEHRTGKPSAMRWCSSVLSKLARVREVRLRLAETTLASADAELCAAMTVESRANADLAEAAERFAGQTAQANEALMQRASGGRVGISRWQEARKGARLALEADRRKLEDAVSVRIGKELALSTARRQWREANLEVERLKLLSRPPGDSTP